MSTGEEPLERVLSQLDRWRHLPKYRLEQHVDVLFGLTLPTVIAERFKVRKEELHVVPEFPIKHADSYQSWNVDFAVFEKASNRMFLVELKTDDRSIDQPQIDQMRRISSCSGLVKDILRLAAQGDQKRKYVHLVSELVRAGVMAVEPKLRSLDLSEKNVKLVAALGDSRASKTNATKLVLIHPCREGSKFKNTCTKGFHCIDFDCYAGIIDGAGPIENQLARHLRRWRSRPGWERPCWPSDASPNPDS